MAAEIDHVVGPVVHLGGTSRQALLLAAVEAGIAVRTAMTRLGDTAPNLRDYHVAEEGRWEKAAAQHRARLDALTQVHAELQQLALLISEDEFKFPLRRTTLRRAGFLGS